MTIFLTSRLFLICLDPLSWNARRHPILARPAVDPVTATVDDATVSHYAPEKLNLENQRRGFAAIESQFPNY